MGRHDLAAPPLPEALEPDELIIPEQEYFILMEDRYGNHVEIPVTHEPLVVPSRFPGRVKVTSLEVKIKGLTHRDVTGKFKTVLLDDGRATLRSSP